MSMMPNDDPCPLRVAIQQIANDRRGRQRFMAMMSGDILCDATPNPICCAAARLLERGFDPSVMIVFEDAVTDFEERMSLAEAIALDDVVVPMRRRATK